MRWIVLILMSLVPLYSCGQDLKGEVVDERLNAIPFANVALYSEDSMFVERGLHVRGGDGDRRGRGV